MIRRIVWVAAGLAAGAAHAAAADAKAAWKFAFGSGGAGEGVIAVPKGASYTAERGYGFDFGTMPRVREGFVTSDQPFFFSVKVPEGNFRVTVRLGNEMGESVTTVKAESRRLMLERVVTEAGEIETRSFIVNVRTSKVPPPPLNAPGSDHVELNNREQTTDGVVLHWDDKLTLEFSNVSPKLRAIEIEPVTVPTVFLAGDSTVTDQVREPTTSWGQMLTRFLKTEVAVANHAESGETLKSFITELRLDKLLSQMKAGDALLIQFGHNDSKASWPQTYAEAGTTYKAYLRAFVAEARRRGATPVILSPMERRSGGNGNTHGGYPQAAKEVAAEEKVAFVDLWSMSKTLYQALGADVGKAFNDGTHHSAYGAYELAKCVVAGLQEQHVELAKYVVEDFGAFDPAKPDAVAAFAVPVSPGKAKEAPRGN